MPSLSSHIKNCNRPLAYSSLYLLLRRRTEEEVRKKATYAKGSIKLYERHYFFAKKHLPMRVFLKLKPYNCTPFF